jgi:hypothetical protein
VFSNFGFGFQQSKEAGNRESYVLAKIVPRIRKGKYVLFSHK